MEEILHYFFENLLRSDVIVVDEVSMMSSEMLDVILYRLGQFIQHMDKIGRAYTLPKLLFVGDLLQLAPVTGNFITNNETFMQAPVTLLEKVWRTDDEEFIRQLHMIRQGDIDPDFLDPLMSDGDFFDEEYFHLFSTNREANNLNQSKLKELDSETRAYTPTMGKDSNILDGRNENAIIKFKEMARIEDPLILKIGARVLITKNGDGLVNGDSGKIVAMYDNSVDVLISRFNAADFY